MVSHTWTILLLSMIKWLNLRAKGERWMTLTLLLALVSPFQYSLPSLNWKNKNDMWYFSVVFLPASTSVRSSFWPQWLEVKEEFTQIVTCVNFWLCHAAIIQNVFSYLLPWKKQHSFSLHWQIILLQRSNSTHPDLLVEVWNPARESFLQSKTRCWVDMGWPSNWGNTTNEERQNTIKVTRTGWKIKGIRTAAAEEAFWAFVYPTLAGRVFVITDNIAPAGLKRLIEDCSLSLLFGWVEVALPFVFPGLSSPGCLKALRGDVLASWEPALSGAINAYHSSWPSPLLLRPSLSRQTHLKLSTTNPYRWRSTFFPEDHCTLPTYTLTRAWTDYSCFSAAVSSTSSHWLEGVFW